VVDQLLSAHHPPSKERPRPEAPPAARRPTATATATATAENSHGGRRLDRGAYAADMLARLACEGPDAAGSPGGAPSQTPLLSTREAEVVADLLDGLAGVHPDEDLGQLARSLSARLWERLAR
jgi:hypothetical protein